MLRLSGYGLQIRLSGLLQINRECENYAKRCSHGDRHLGMGASSPKMRIGKRKSAASVSFRLGGVFVRK